MPVVGKGQGIIDNGPAGSFRSKEVGLLARTRSPLNIFAGLAL